MRLPLALSLAPVVTALQTIYLGTISASGYRGNYIAWFSDSDVCNDGTRFGSLLQNFQNCNENLTLLGHDNITFTGCKQTGTLPTGVSDAGAPALKCKARGNPGGASYYRKCEGSQNYGYVSILEYCS